MQNLTFNYRKKPHMRNLKLNFQALDIKIKNCMNFKCCIIYTFLTLNFHKNEIVLISMNIFDIFFFCKNSL